jgi:hypothetical protein
MCYFSQYCTEGINGDKYGCETFFEMFTVIYKCNKRNKSFGTLQYIKLLTLSVKNKPEIKHT